MFTSYIVCETSTNRILCSLVHCSTVAHIYNTIAPMFDRANPSVKVYHDLALNVAIFLSAVVLMRRYGHMLAV